MPQQEQSKQILGRAKTIRELLNGAKYSIDYYQREYKWQEKQIVELINDLSNTFLESYDESHQRKAVAQYGHYFLGSIIISQKDGHNFIIDGQQRLTSLTLLLIHLHNLQQGMQDKVNIDELIFSEKFGDKSFNIDVPERTQCMEALFENQPFEENGQPESIQNIVSRHEDIRESFPEELCDNALPYFIDWLIENVHLVEITAYSDEDAYKIFETMNDRGLSLAPTEMLKGYLLANIDDGKKRTECNNLWKKLVGVLNEIGKEEDSDCLKAWFRSQHAKSIRERKKGAKPQDFDRIGTEFHRWIRDNETVLGLKDTDGFVSFINKDYKFYATQYCKLRLASFDYDADLEHVFYNAQIRFTQQYHVLLAPLLPDDPLEIIRCKLRLVAIYLDIMLNRRMWNCRSNGYSNLQYTIFQLTKSIRNKEPHELAKILLQKLDEEKETFVNSRLDYYLHGQNRKHIKHILARMTAFLEEKSETTSHYVEYVTSKGKKAYEVEHIWADHPDRHLEEFEHPADFQKHRNLFGGLLLLPKSFNASYGDLTYEKKLKHYNSQNILARSLHPDSYEHNPGFVKFIRESGLEFQHYEHFKKDSVLERQKLYQQLAELVWDPSQLQKELEILSSEDVA